jgi:hypothetical protein
MSSLNDYSCHVVSCPTETERLAKPTRAPDGSSPTGPTCLAYVVADQSRSHRRALSASYPDMPGRADLPSLASRMVTTTPPAAPGLVGSSRVTPCLSGSTFRVNPYLERHLALPSPNDKPSTCHDTSGRLLHTVLVSSVSGHIDLPIAGLDASESHLLTFLAMSCSNRFWSSLRDSSSRPANPSHPTTPGRSWSRPASPHRQLSPRLLQSRRPVVPSACRSTVDMTSHRTSTRPTSTSRAAPRREQIRVQIGL